MSVSRLQSITRFQVMAVLQAARARTFGLKAKEAKSWGLNRALFYAAAKRSWQKAKLVGAKRPIISEYENSVKRHDPIYVLGGEKAFRVRNLTDGLRFKFGDEVQTPTEFDRQIKEKFGGNWKTVWTEAEKIIKSVDRRDLDIQSRFFNSVYKPRRDDLSMRWSELCIKSKKKLTYNEPLRRLSNTLKRKRAA
jgi:hypothetical protein